jgi:hypothetical protein
MTFHHSRCLGKPLHDPRSALANRFFLWWTTLTRGESMSRTHGTKDGPDGRTAGQAYEDLCARLGQERRVLVAFSGGADSALLAVAAHRVLGAAERDRLVETQSVGSPATCCSGCAARARAPLEDVRAEDASFTCAVEALRGDRMLLGRDGDLPGSLSVAEVITDPTDEVDRRCTALRPDDVAKILFTSGSTRSRRSASARTPVAGLLPANAWADKVELARRADLVQQNSVWERSGTRAMIVVPICCRERRLAMRNDDEL